ncbi:hypothetical protein D9M70_609930 [compost metagenome]
MCPPHHGTQACAEFAGFEGFDDVVVGTGVQAADTIAQLVAGRDDEDRSGVVALAQRSQHIQPGPARQAKVQQDRRVAVLDQREPSRRRIFGTIDGPAILCQCGGQCVTEHAIVFNQEQARHGRPLGMAGAPC